ncbi:hypothetical protein BK124_02945 [Paenibacillus amylolyticus]|nr:hypothetical protein EL84_22865 [Paenibacillus sp. VT-400]OMF01632.1 hypothetical protein BK124_02945 [Paenibacillus amylolyticus]
MQVSDHVPGYKGKTVGVARQSDVFIFHSPIGNFGDAEYLTCCKLSRSDFVEPFKRSTQRNNGSNRKNSTVYFNYLKNGLCPLYKPIGKKMGRCITILDFMEKRYRKPLIF